MYGLVHTFYANDEDDNHKLHSAKCMFETCNKDVSDTEKPKSLLDLIRIPGLHEQAFPELYRLAKIPVVLPVSSFALKSIKTTLSNTIGNERLRHLYVLSNESKRVKGLVLETFVDKFADNNKNSRILLK